MGGSRCIYAGQSHTCKTQHTGHKQGERCDNDCGGGDSVKPVYVQNGRRRRHAVEKEARRIKQAEKDTRGRRKRARANEY